MNAITAVILAQGKNKRIGLAKSLLEINGISIIEKEVKLLKTIFDNIIIISEKEELKRRFPDIKFYDDIYKEIGPLGGIHSALYHISSGSAFVFACDMPNLSKDIITRQIKLYLKSRIEIVVPRHSQGIEPLHAIYHKRAIMNINQIISQKIYSIRSFYKGMRIKYFDVTDEEIKYFYNVNTMKEYKNLTKVI